MGLVHEKHMPLMVAKKEISNDWGRGGQMALTIRVLDHGNLRGEIAT